jgi:type VI protein secretion system component VasK
MGSTRTCAVPATAPEPLEHDMTRRTIGRTSARLLVVGVALVAMAACSSDKTSGGSSTTAAAATTAAGTTTTVSGGTATTGTGGSSAALCTARDNLQKSFDDLKSVNILQNGTAGLQTALTDVQTNLQAVKASASADLQPQVKAFEDSLANLQTALKNATSGNVAGVATAATAVVSSGATLLGALQSLQCS